MKTPKGYKKKCDDVGVVWFERVTFHRRCPQLSLNGFIRDGLLRTADMIQFGKAPRVRHKREFWKTQTLVPGNWNPDFYHYQTE